MMINSEVSNISFLYNHTQYLQRQLQLLTQNPLEFLYFNNHNRIQQYGPFQNQIKQNQIPRQKIEPVTLLIKNVKLEYNPEKQKNDQKSSLLERTIHQNPLQNQDETKTKMYCLTNNSSEMVQKYSEIQKQIVNQIILRKKIEKRIKGQTKNIPKNFGKAIISFIQKQKKKVQSCLKVYNLKYDEFMNTCIEKKNNIQTISELRALWIDNKFEKPMRILSNLFLRKYCFKYIFNSRIQTYSCHIKCKQKLKESIKTPYNFKNMKDF